MGFAVLEEIEHQNMVTCSCFFFPSGCCSSSIGFPLKLFCQEMCLPTFYTSAKFSNHKTDLQCGDCHLYVRNDRKVDSLEMSGHMSAGDFQQERSIFIELAALLVFMLLGHS